MRWPLITLFQCTINARMIGFWYRLIHGKNTKLSLMLYQCLRHSRARSQWLTYIENIFVTIGRPDIWEFQQTFNMSSFTSYVKTILFDQYLQNWRGNSDQSSKAFTYFSFKSEYAIEKYFISLPRTHYLNLFKFRTGNHKLPVEVGRWDDSPLDDRKCSLCTLDEVGDEYHYLLQCPYFKTQRQLYIKPYYARRPSMIKFCELNKSNDTTVLTKLSKFVKIIIDKFK